MLFLYAYPSQSVDGAEEYHKKSYGHLTTVFYFKVIHPKYYKHLKKGAYQSHLGRQKIGWFLAALTCTSSKTDNILNKIVFVPELSS